MMTMLSVADNTGVKAIRVISVHKAKRHGHLGDMVTASVREASADAKAKRGDVLRALVIRTRMETVRRDGRSLTWSDNAAVLLTPDEKPMGTRIYGPVPLELRSQRWLKVMSLAAGQAI